MIEDTSPNFSETKAFLDRRLEDVGNFGKARAEAGSVLEFFSKSLVGVAESVGSITRL
jgi:ubiquinone biosynthesis protein COQ9